MTFTALAASSDWSDLGGGKVRMHATMDPLSGKVSGVVEVALKKGWSTYWRYPGSAGIPPKFDFSRSASFLPGHVQFPAPQLVTHPYGSYAGYKNRVLFPFNGEMSSTRNGAIVLDLLIGVCAEVCIPATASMEIETKQLQVSDPIAVQNYGLASLSIPKRMVAADVINSVDFLNERKDVLLISVKNRKGSGTPVLFVEGPKEWYLTPAQFHDRNDGETVFALDVSRAPKDADILNEELRFTLVTGSFGIEIVR